MIGSVRTSEFPESLAAGSGAGPSSHGIRYMYACTIFLSLSNCPHSQHNIASCHSDFESGGGYHSQIHDHMQEGGDEEDPEEDDYPPPAAEGFGYVYHLSVYLCMD